MATLSIIDKKVYRVQKKVIKQHVTVRACMKEVIRLNLNAIH